MAAPTSSKLTREKSLGPAESVKGETEGFFAALKARFEAHMERHPDVEWSRVQERLEAAPAKLRSLQGMERTGGEPDVVQRGKAAGGYVFIDCSTQSPSGRRSLCFDRAARVGRKEHPPKSSAQEIAETLGIELLTEQQYRDLQTVGKFDTTTSSWVQTPPEIRKLGGALFCDRRYEAVFLYHNGADSYYAARGFRGSLRV